MGRASNNHTLKHVVAIITKMAIHDITTICERIVQRGEVGRGEYLPGWRSWWRVGLIGQLFGAN